MSDFIITNATTIDNKSVDIEIQKGIIDRVVPSGEGDPDHYGERHFCAEGRLVTPTLIEPHTHLDITLTAGNPIWNESNRLRDGIRKWRDLDETITKQGTKQRARKGIKWFLSHGVTKIRTHASIGNTCEGVKALVELRDEFEDFIDLQIAVIPGEGVTSEPELRRLHQSLDLGADVVGGIPHIEYVPEDGNHHVKTVVDIADSYNLKLDLHIDESDDPQKRYTAVLANEVNKRDIGSRATASHVTSLHSHSNAYADEMIHMISESRLNVVTNPMANAALQGKHDSYPKRRGHTRIKELRQGGVTVGVGQDDILTYINNYGDGDPLKNLFILSHYAHMNGYHDVEPLWDMMIEGNSQIFGVSDYGIREGNEGSLIVYDSYDSFDALRLQAPRLLVIHEGNIIAETSKNTQLYLDDKEKIDYSRKPYPPL